MKTRFILTVLLACCCICLVLSDARAQDITARLGGATSGDTFDVKNIWDDTILSVSGDGVIHFIGDVQTDQEQVNNTLLGMAVGNPTGERNTGLGYMTFYDAPSGSDNTAAGTYALSGDTTGFSNTAVGASALGNNETGNRNTAVGHAALLNSVSASGSTAVGAAALQNNTAGYNTAMGVYALTANTDGSNNTAVGSMAMYVNETGAYNTAVGNESLKNNTASSNTAVGNYSLYANTSGASNTAVGRSALGAVTTSGYDTAVGAYALQLNTAADNTAMGYYGLRSNTTGTANTAMGMSALALNVLGDGNTAVGAYALNNSNTSNTISQNTALGAYVLYNNTTGVYNTASGASALSSNVTGGYNTALGMNALAASTGSYNTALGAMAGVNITSGSYNIIIGAGINALYPTGSNQLNIGNTIYGGLATDTVGLGCNDSAHDLTIGASGLSCAAGAWSWIDAGSAAFTASSSREIKENITPVAADGILEKMLAVPVTTYDFKASYCGGEPDACKDKLGLIAEDFHQVFRRGSDKEINGQDVQMALWLAVQQLTERNKALQQQVQAQQAKIEELEKDRLHAAGLEKRLDALEQRIAQAAASGDETVADNRAPVPGHVSAMALPPVYAWGLLPAAVAGLLYGVRRRRTQNRSR